MFSENNIFFVLKNKKQKIVFNCQMYFFYVFLVLDNRKLFSKIFSKQTLNLYFAYKIKIHLKTQFEHIIIFVI